MLKSAQADWGRGLWSQPVPNNSASRAATIEKVRPNMGQVRRYTWDMAMLINCWFSARVWGTGSEPGSLWGTKCRIKI